MSPIVTVKLTSTTRKYIQQNNTSSAWAALGQTSFWSVN